MTPEAEIRRRIGERGRITFAEFMEVALYWPGGGYYCGGSSPAGPDDSVESGPFGAAGDYYTAPLAHPAFGALLAVQLYQFWQLLDCPRPFYVVEPGAGSGQLCRDILAAATGLPDGFGKALRYLCLDRTHYRPPPYGDDSRAAPIIADGIPLRNLRGCIISNELLDAFPVHQVRVEQGKLWEVCIGLAEGSDDTAAPLVEVLAEPSTPALAARLDELGIVLAEGQTAEINLNLDSWAGQTAAALEAGFVLTIDYGHRAAELYDPQTRPRGTLVTYRRHVQTDAPLRQIGNQDITAQVDFTAAANAGRRAGLSPVAYLTQREFLRNLGLDHLRRRVTSTPLPLAQATANRAGLLALTRPDGLGNFKVLVQEKNVEVIPEQVTAGAGGATAADAGRQRQLWGSAPASAALELVHALPLPLLADGHISLPRGWPQPAVQEFELTDLWAGPFNQ